MKNHNDNSVSLLISEVFPPRVGGSGQWLHDIYSRLPSERCVFLVDKTDGDEAFDQNSDLRITRTDMQTASWTLFTLQGIRYFLRLIRATLKLHKNHRFKEIHCGRVMPEGFIGLISARLTRSRLVCYIHGEDIEISRDSREHRWMTQLVLSRADRLICNCYHTQKLLLDSWQCNPEVVRVLHPRTDTNLFKPLDTRLSVRERFGWQGRKVILTVSRLNVRKGHDKLIKALPKIIEQCPETLYVIVGGGLERPFGKSLQSLVEELNLTDHVTFMGERELDSMVEHYQCADLFVLPNYQIGGNLEGFGIVLLEAQACGIPVIAGDSGGTVETMVPEKTGLLVDCTNPENLIHPVSRLLQDDDLREKMGASGRQLIVERFSWNNFDEMVAETVQLDYSENKHPQPK